MKNEVNVYQNNDFDQENLHHMDELSKDADYEPNLSDDSQSDDLSTDDWYIDYMNFLLKALNGTKNDLNQVIKVYNISTFKVQFLKISVE